MGLTVNYFMPKSLSKHQSVSVDQIDRLIVNQFRYTFDEPSSFKQEDELQITDKKTIQHFYEACTNTTAKRILNYDKLRYGSDSGIIERESLDNEVFYRVTILFTPNANITHLPGGIMTIFDDYIVGIEGKHLRVTANQLIKFLNEQ